MAEFQKVVADAKRMCKAHQHCGECPVNNKCVIGYNINNWELFPHFDAFVEQWAAEHPVKTNRMALQDVFPNFEEQSICKRTLTGENPKNICDYDSQHCIECSKKWLDSEYKGGVNNG